MAELIETAIFIVVGTIVGITVGALPGLTATSTIALLIPITFYVKTVPAIAFLLAIYNAALMAGSYASIIVGIPGTPAATATRLDGYPMALRGKGSEALIIATISSFIGTCVSLVFLFTISEPLARLSLFFNSPEYFALALLGLVICSSVSGGSIIKGLIGAFLGMFLAVVGIDPVGGIPRFTFGFFELFEGIPYIPAMIGIFGLAEVFAYLSDSSRSNRIASEKEPLGKFTFPSLKKIINLIPTMFRGGLIGTFVGMIPGLGGNVAAFLHYGLTKRISGKKKDDIDFGKGNPQGVAASESANNGVTGGALVPLLAFGIPGDSVAAVLLGALRITGLQTGFKLFEEHKSTLYMIFSSLGVANVVMLILGLAFVRIYVKLLNTPKYLLYPLIVILCLVGSISVRGIVFDSMIALLFGLLGWLMIKLKIPRVTLVLGLILGPMLEENFRRSMIMSQQSLLVFLEHPISLMFLISSAAVIVFSVIFKLKRSS